MASLQRCPNGHYYNPGINKICPYCNNTDSDPDRPADAPAPSSDYATILLNELINGPGKRSDAGVDADRTVAIPVRSSDSATVLLSELMYGPDDRSGADDDPDRTSVIPSPDSEPETKILDESADDQDDRSGADDDPDRTIVIPGPDRRKNTIPVNSFDYDDHKPDKRSDERREPEWVISPNLLDPEAIRAAKDKHRPLVVGWLVAVKGPYCGRSFEIHRGNTYIGREEGDIVLPKDQGISPSKNASTVYDERKNRFLLVAGQTAELVYVDDELVPCTSYAVLKPYSSIELGDSTFLFMPLCSDKFKWTP